MPDWKRPALAGYFIIFLGFGVLGGWSAFARLDSAVVASGTVTLESSKKIIQHFEGGIIAKILVHEGEHVEQGQILFLLDNTAPQANANAVRNQLDAYLAQEARLVAERNGAEKVTYPPELTDDASQPVIKDAISDQSKQFTERRASLAGQIAILESRIKQFETQIDGITDEKKSTEEQLGFINSELTDLRELLAENLVQKTRVLALERENARLEGVIGRAVADIAKARNDIGEAHLQIEQLHKKFSEDVNDQILQVRQKIAELREKTAVSQDVLQRIQIRAPRSGTIQKSPGHDSRWRDSHRRAISGAYSGRGKSCDQCRGLTDGRRCYRCWDGGRGKVFRLSRLHTAAHLRPCRHRFARPDY